MKLLVFEGSAGEISDLLERMPQLNSGAITQVTKGSAPPVSTNNSPAFAVWTREKMERMYSHLYGDQLKFVDYILAAPNARVLTREAQKFLGFGQGPQIAGVLSSITRNARRITKFREARLVEDWFDEKAQKWGYRLPEPALSLLREVVSAAKKKL
jgi:hypothetical protein